jgi:multidrug efflux system membrane fusion protein
LAQAEATRKKDLAQLVNARQETERAGKLASAGAGTGQTYDAMKAQEAALQASVDADQAAVDAARLNLDFTRIVAPFAGRLGLRQVSPGSIVHASDTSGIVTLTQMAPIAVLFPLPQDDLGVALAAQRTGDAPVAADTRDGAIHLADGHLAVINNAVDAATGQIQLKAVFDNADAALWPGEFVSVRVLVRTDRGVIAVPAQAVLVGESGSYVYVTKPDGTAAVQSVTTGPTVDGFTQILSGIAAGQEIIIDGQARLKPGSRFTLTAASASTQGNAP